MDNIRLAIVSPRVDAVDTIGWHSCPLARTMPPADARCALEGQRREAESPSGPLDDETGPYPCA